MVNGRSSIVAARINAPATAQFRQHGRLAWPEARPVHAASQPAYPRLARETPAEPPRLSREVCARQYEWDERWDGLS